MPPTGIIPLSVRLAAFHRDIRDWHLEMARKHGDHGHERAEQDHLEAAAVHEAAMAKPLDERLAGAARRASGLADEASQKVGVTTPQLCHRRRGYPLNAEACSTARAHRHEGGCCRLQTPGCALAPSKRAHTRLQRLPAGVRSAARVVSSRTVPCVAFSVSERLEAFHASQRDWHRDMAEAHREHGHAEAERRHRAAAAAHEAAIVTPMDAFSAGVAMQASNRADEASLASGVKPSADWPPL